jgi:hypothetical protein
MTIRGVQPEFENIIKKNKAEIREVKEKAMRDLDREKESFE